MNVYLNEYIHPAAVDLLRENAEIINNFDHPEELDGIIVRGIQVTREILEKCPNLKVVGRHGVGVENIDLEAAREFGIRVVNAPLENAVSVAEMMVGMIIEASRDFRRAHEGLRNGEFSRIAPQELMGMEITGKTLGLIGMGNIAIMTAQMMKAAFHVEALGYDPYIDADEAERRGMKKIDTLEELLERSDIVALIVPLTPQTQNMISGDVFNHFKKNAVFVNDARGKIVNEDDLYEALKAGKLRAAAMDVFATDPAPLPKDNKLLTLENFYASPHIGGNTEEAVYRTGMAVVQKVLDIINGKNVDQLVA